MNTVYPRTYSRDLLAGSISLNGTRSPIALRTINSRCYFIKEALKLDRLYLSNEMVGKVGLSSFIY